MTTDAKRLRKMADSVDLAESSDLRRVVDFRQAAAILRGLADTAEERERS